MSDGGRPALPETTSRRGLLVGLALGLPVIGYGVRGALVDAGATHPPELARWIVGTAVVHDLVLVPAALGIAGAARRLTPPRAWPPVRVGLIASGVLGLVAWPFVRGYGDDPTNPSLFPRDYAGGLGAALVVVWLAVALWLSGRQARQFHLRRHARPPETRAVAHPDGPGEEPSREG
ncbi:MAG TPA: hypothetical protein VE575_15010 [Acidimicrobiales bacterium]|nr:hypothetical protein [Acidimicrobiales bacterium]